LTNVIRISETQVDLVRRLWRENVPEFDIALAIGVGMSTFRRLRRRQLKALPRRSHKCRDSGRRAQDPTPEELAERIAEVQKSWGPLERIERSSNVVGTSSTMVRVRDIREAIRNG